MNLGAVLAKPRRFLLHMFILFPSRVIHTSLAQTTPLNHTVQVLEVCRKKSFEAFISGICVLTHILSSLSLTLSVSPPPAPFVPTPLKAECNLLLWAHTHTISVPSLSHYFTLPCYTQGSKISTLLLLKVVLPPFFFSCCSWIWCYTNRLKMATHTLHMG